MKIETSHFENTTLGMSYAIDYVKYRYDQMRGRRDALEFAAIELRRVAEQMDRIRAEFDLEFTPNLK